MEVAAGRRSARVMFVVVGALLTMIALFAWTESRSQVVVEVSRPRSSRHHR